MIKLNKALIEARLVEREMTWKELSEKAGVAPNTIRTASKDLGKITVATLERIAIALGVKVIDLFEE